MVSLFLLLGCNLSYIVDLFAALHELASASARTLLKLASSVMTSPSFFVFKSFFKVSLKVSPENFTEGNSRNLIRMFLFFHLKSNYVIRLGTRQDRYVGMRKFSNHAVLSVSDSTMAVSSKDTQDLSVQIVFFTFSFKWFLCFYFWTVI